MAAEEAMVLRSRDLRAPGSLCLVVVPIVNGGCVLGNCDSAYDNAKLQVACITFASDSTHGAFILYTHMRKLCDYVFGPYEY